jgi:hypothetical protein
MTVFHPRSFCPVAVLVATLAALTGTGAQQPAPPA